MVIVLGLLLTLVGYGDGEFFGYVSVLLGIIAALIMGRQHVRSLKKKPPDEAAPEDSKPHTFFKTLGRSTGRLLGKLKRSI